MSECAASSGVSTATVPIFEAPGHVLGSVENALVCASKPICWFVHPCRPYADDGLSATPAGSVTEAFLSVDVARPAGSSFCGTLMSTW